MTGCESRNGTVSVPPVLLRVSPASFSRGVRSASQRNDLAGTGNKWGHSGVKLATVKLSASGLAF